jgi:hypothetical protein
VRIDSSRTSMATPQLWYFVGRLPPASKRFLGFSHAPQGLQPQSAICYLTSVRRRAQEHFRNCIGVVNSGLTGQVASVTISMTHSGPTHRGPRIRSNLRRCVAARQGSLRRKSISHLPGGFKLNPYEGETHARKRAFRCVGAPPVQVALGQNCLDPGSPWCTVNQITAAA